MTKEDSLDNSFGVASLVFGVLSILLSFLVIPGLVCGILGLTFGIIQLRKSKNKWGIWGVVLSSIGLILGVLVIYAIMAILSAIQQSMELVRQCQSDPTLPGCEQIKQFITQQSGGIQ